jgi:hypothetical protein
MARYETIKRLQNVIVTSPENKPLELDDAAIGAKLRPGVD